VSRGDEDRSARHRSARTTTGSVEVDLVSVTGSRVNCTGTAGLHLHVLGKAVVANGTLDQSVTIPNNPGVNTLGGWHAIVVIKGAMGTDGAGNRCPALQPGRGSSPLLREGEHHALLQQGG